MGHAPLIGHRRLDDVAAWRAGAPVTARAFLADVMRVASTLPPRGHALNVCTDKYAFAVNFLAALVKGHPTLLPPAATSNFVEALKAFAPDAYCLSDGDASGIDLPRVAPPGPSAQAPAIDAVPAIDGDRLAAVVFTSGSTGQPRPYEKRWRTLVGSASAEAARLEVTARHTVLGTVPPQHMYGLESTVMLPLVTGGSFVAERPFFPAEIDACVRAVKAPRILFTTPFHLRNWLESGNVERVERIVSATAPLMADLARRAEAEACAALFEIYGCTETGQLATRRPTEDAAWAPYDGLRIEADPACGRASGGHVESPMQLPDVLEMHADGRRFHLVGRSTDLLNIAGKRNSLAWLNQQLLEVPGVEDGTFHMPDGDGSDMSRLMAFVVAPGLDARVLLDALRQRMDPVFLPRPLVMVESLPRRTTGKIPREALVALERANRRDP